MWFGSHAIPNPYTHTMNSLMSSPLFLFIFISISLLPSILSKPPPLIPPSYKRLCSSIVPHSPPTTPFYNPHLRSFTTTYFSGGHRLFPRPDNNHTFYYGQNSVKLQIRPNSHETITPGVYMIQASLFVSSPYAVGDLERGAVEFLLTGFWSNVTSMACMIGSTDLESMSFTGVLKLKYPRDVNPSIRTSVATGTLESVSAKNNTAYFDTISMIHFPTFSDYDYALVSSEIEPSGCSTVSHSPIPSHFCNWLWMYGYFDMEYGAECEETKNCSPLSNSYLPSLLSLGSIECSETDRRMRYLARFGDGTYSIHGSFSFDSTLIAEGSWDDKNERLFISACRILNPIDHLDDPVGDCDIRMSLRHPSVWTIRDALGLSGELWSRGSILNDKNAHRRPINLTTSDHVNVRGGIPGLRYEYTEMRRVKSCLLKKPTKMQRKYPDGQSRNMVFNPNIRNSKGENCGWGYATPLFVGNEMFRGDIVASTSMSEFISLTEFGYNGSAWALVSKISYKISITSIVDSSGRAPLLNMSMNRRGKMEINAEGIYDAATGQLCMVGCRKLGNLSSISTDCEIVIKFEFPPLDTKIRDRINGSIASTRQIGDPLHFEELTLTDTVSHTEMAQNISQLEEEIIISMIYYTLLGIFVCVQILHVKRNPKIASSISSMMTLILLLEYAMYLFGETDDRYKVLYTEHTWLKTTNYAISIVELLLHAWLLQLVWTAKWKDKNSWKVERMPWFVTLAVYIYGALMALLIRHVIGKGPIHDFARDGLECYPCLIVFSALFPQIVLNFFRSSTERALCRTFYIGLSMVRVFPFLYFQYCTVLRVVTPVGVAVMGAVVHLQQHYGGRCIVPRWF